MGQEIHLADQISGRIEEPVGRKDLAYRMRCVAATTAELSTMA
jgi:hypothetical protein